MQDLVFTHSLRICWLSLYRCKVSLYSVADAGYKLTVARTSKLQHCRAVSLAEGQFMQLKVTGN